MEREDALSSSPTNVNGSLSEIRPYPYSGRYFSFPSFDTWEVDQQEKGEGEIKTP